MYGIKVKPQDIAIGYLNLMQSSLSNTAYLSMVLLGLDIKTDQQKDTFIKTIDGLVQTWKGLRDFESETKSSGNWAGPTHTDIRQAKNIELLLWELNPTLMLNVIKAKQFEPCQSDGFMYLGR
ncbi:MAG TPA: hypothetical protein VJJ52_05730 [Candidatus Nanoarchaeia archaeon]|nr:hypothetical protein [Candidatus Nanoarchaeia archaeon]